MKEDEKFWDTTWVHGLPVRIKCNKGKNQGERVRCDISIVQTALSLKLENTLLRGCFGLWRHSHTHSEEVG